MTNELLTNTVEIVSAPHHRARDAVADLTRLVERVSAIAEPMGVDLISSGTHPFSQWFQQQVTPGKPRYDTLIDRTRWWGRQMMIWGVHVHVAVEDRRKVLPIIDGLLTYLPHFQALSASSPFWAGENTGYASNRALMFQQLPTAGSAAAVHRVVAVRGDGGRPAAHRRHRGAERAALGHPARHRSGARSRCGPSTGSPPRARSARSRP